MNRTFRLMPGRPVISINQGDARMSHRPCGGGHINCEESIAIPNNQMHA